MATDPEHPYVGRGALKLRHALDVFGIDVRGMRCADFGCNVGGFTDCLLRAGAAHVYAVDTGYGALAWKLRKDPRVTVMERTNALHAPAPPADDRVDLVAIDMGWTPQRLCVPAAVAWLREGGRIVTLVKPHYEVEGAEKESLRRGVLAEAEAPKVVERVVAAMPALGVRVLGCVESPVTGGKAGNREWLAVLATEPRP